MIDIPLDRILSAKLLFHSDSAVAILSDVCFHLLDRVCAVALLQQFDDLGQHQRCIRGFLRCISHMDTFHHTGTIVNDRP